MEPLTCDDCACTQFLLFGEMRESTIVFFHTKCTACGKRGALSLNVETKQALEFTQFIDPQKGL